jgi:O-methyltransferase involved in polyketide biosynthesis
MKMQLSDIQKTAFITLIWRAYYSYQKTPVFKDEKAEYLANNIKFDYFNELPEWVRNPHEGLLARALKLDYEIKKYIEKNPDGLIVDLGCGLDTGFYRNDNGKVKWVNIDFPEIIELRKIFLPESTRVFEIGKSILDFSWIKDVKKISPKNVLFLAVGVLQYLEENEVKELFSAMAENFLSSTLFFGMPFKEELEQANKYFENSPLNVKYKCGIDENPKEELESVSPFIKVTQMSYPFDNILNGYLNEQQKEIFNKESYLKYIHMEFTNICKN